MTINKVGISEIVGISTLAALGTLNHVLNAKAWSIGCSLKAVAVYGVIETLAFCLLSPMMAERSEQYLGPHFGQGKLIKITEENKVILNVGIGLIAAKIMSLCIGKLIANKFGHHMTDDHVKKLALWQLIDISLSYYYYHNQSHDSIPPLSQS